MFSALDGPLSSPSISGRAAGLGGGFWPHLEAGAGPVFAASHIEVAHEGKTGDTKCNGR